MGKLVEVTDSNFKAEVTDSDRPVLLEFTAAWCPPCRALKPVLEGISDEFEGRLKVAMLDVDSNQEACSAWQVQSMPTLLLFKGGKVVSAAVGFRPKSEIMKMLQ